MMAMQRSAAIADVILSFVDLFGSVQCGTAHMCVSTMLIREKPQIPF